MKAMQSMNNPKVETRNLKDQAWEILRDMIIKGQLQPDQKLTEREVMQLLGIGRMPARDALMRLEEQGLVVNKPDARYVVKLGPQDIQNLFDVRKSLEILAVTAAARQATPEDCQQLRNSLDVMREAIAHQDTEAFVHSDLNIHEAIWQMSRNRYLIKMLNSMIDPISTFIASHTGLQHDRDDVLQLHIQLIDAISTGDVDAAILAMQSHMDDSLAWSLRVFKDSE
ncbi:MAG: FCD domain-containing protein [Chloroflexi bacterium]|nr:FCD domain-containing protein [Chloroflexota bacterium]